MELDKDRLQEIAKEHEIKINLIVWARFLRDKKFLMIEGIEGKEMYGYNDWKHVFTVFNRVPFKLYRIPSLELIWTTSGSSSVG